MFPQACLLCTVSSECDQPWQGPDPGSITMCPSMELRRMTLSCEYILTSDQLLYKWCLRMLPARAVELDSLLPLLVLPLVLPAIDTCVHRCVGGRVGKMGMCTSCCGGACVGRSAPRLELAASQFVWASLFRV